MSELSTALAAILAEAFDTTTPEAPVAPAGGNTVNARIQAILADPTLNANRKVSRVAREIVRANGRVLDTSAAWPTIKGRDPLSLTYEELAPFSREKKSQAKEGTLAHAIATGTVNYEAKPKTHRWGSKLVTAKQYEHFLAVTKPQNVPAVHGPVDAAEPVAEVGDDTQAVLREAVAKLPAEAQAKLLALLS